MSTDDLSLLEREESFHGWPSSANVTGKALAKAGFRYSGSKDMVQCSYCGGRLYNWKPGDDPVVEHLRYFKNCSYALRASSSTSFIPSPWSWIRARLDLPSVRIVLDYVPRSAVIKALLTRMYQTTPKGDPGEFSSPKELMAAAMEVEIEKAREKGREPRLKRYVNIPDDSDGALDKDAHESGLSLLFKRDSANPVSNVEPMQRAHNLGGDQEEAEAVPDSASELCVKCEVTKPEVFFLPCRHLVVCLGCSERLKTCPQCCVIVKHRMRIFASH